MTNQKDNLSRRKFLAASLSGLATAGLAGFTACSDQAESTPDSAPWPQGELVTRTLGRTGLQIPIVNAGGTTTADPSFIQAEYEAGLRLFDTDARYLNGRHERLLGRAFDHMGVRNDVIIMTKVHTPEQRAGLNARESKDLLYRTLEGCLRRLKTDYVDILLVHDVSYPGPIKDPAIMETMTRIKEEGKARFLGTATHTNMAVAIDATVEAEIYDVVLTSVNFTMADDTRLLGAIENATRKGVGVIAMKTQVGGRSFPNPGKLKRYGEALVNSAALKWVCNNENIATSIPGIATYDHLRVDLAVGMDPEYTATEKEFLADLDIRLGMEFCRQCQLCVSDCPYGVDIPTLMRTHMYARQYADFETARRTFDSIPSDRGLAACTACNKCQVACANSVNIPRKIEELKLVYA